MENRPLLLKYIITAIVLLMGITALMLSCRSTNPGLRSPDSGVRKTEDSTWIRLIPVDSVQGEIPDIGESFSIPSLDVELVRVSESTVLIKTPVRTEVRETVRIVETRSVDKSRTTIRDKSRTDVNSRNRKSGNQDSGNKVRSRHGGDRNSVREKTKTTEKEVSNFPWWWWLIIVGAVAGYVYLKYFSPFRLL